MPLIALDAAQSAAARPNPQLRVDWLSYPLGRAVRNIWKEYFTTERQEHFIGCLYRRIWRLCSWARPQIQWKQEHAT